MGPPFHRWVAVVVAVLVAVPGLALLGSAPSPSSRPSTSLLPGHASPAGSPVGSRADVVLRGVAPSSVRIVAPAYHPPPGTAAVGALSPSSPLDVVVGLAPSHPSGLAAYVAAQQIPGSSAYHAFLTPTEIADRYGPDPAAVGTVRQYFSDYGLRTSTLPGGFLLEVQGSSAGVGSAFGTTFEQYRDASGRLFVSHPTVATLPARLTVTGAYGLGDASPFQTFVRPDATAPVTAAPSVICSPGPAGLLSPCQVQTAYSSSTLISGGTNGSGERIGIVDAYDGGEPQSQLTSDLGAFAGQFGLRPGNLSYAYPVPTAQRDLNISGLNTGWGLEEALDLEWARASAPGASIVMAFSPDPGPGLLYAVNWLVATHAVDVISMSWGEPLTGVYNAYSQPCASACNASTDGTYAILDPVFEAAAAEGISLFAATGDCGALDGTSGVAVNYPAADPFVTAVGGTVLHTASDGAYLAEYGWNGTASGAAAPGCQNQGGSGGGFSDLPRPWWQLGLPTAPGGRATPDVALVAATPVVVVIGGAVGGALGTSIGTPIWAGIAALADQAAGHALGLLNPGLYAIYRGSNYSLDFHDILLGNNGYSAGPGWDPVTGLGTPIVSDLVLDLTGSLPLPAQRPATLLYAAPRFGRAPLTVSFVVNASGGTGNFSILGLNFGDGTSSLSGNVTTHEYLAPGVYSAQGFAVDSGGNASASPPIAIVVGGGHALSVALSASSLTPATGAPVNFTVGASGGHAPYTFDLYFGDGTYAFNQTGTTAVHSYGAPGGYCAEVVARDAATSPDGAASARLAIAVGGAKAPDCGNDSVPLALTPNPVPQVRDAPADFPALFTSTGGAAPPPGLANSIEYRSNTSYVRACECAIFRSPGNYSIEAWVNDTVNQGASARTNVTVAPELVGDFTASTLSGPAPLTVNFSVNVTGGYRADPAATVWEFTSNFTSLPSIVGPSVRQTFDTPGEYLVLGSLSDAGHGNTSRAFVIDVEGNGSARGVGLTATISPAVRLASGATVHYSGAVVGASGTPGLSLYWTFGPSSHGPFDAYGPVVNETYDAPVSPLAADGSPAVNNTLGWSLSILTANGTGVVRVGGVGLELAPFFAVEAAGFIPRTSALAFNASLWPRYGSLPVTVVGAAEVYGPGTKTVGWSFGDGAASSGTSVNHTYAAGGPFTVRTHVRDSFGDEGVASFGVLVAAPLTVTGGPSVSSGPAPLRVTFTVQAFGGTGPPFQYRWTFGSGPSVNGSVVNRTFSSPGTYVATVHVSSNGGKSMVNRSWTLTVERSQELPAGAVLAGAGAIGAAVGLLAAWATRRTRRDSRSPPPTPSRPRAEGDGPRAG